MKPVTFLLAVSLPLLGVTHTVAPSGGDDTAAIQAAFNACAPGDEIRLLAGLYRTRQVIVTGATCSIIGAGMESTTVQPYEILPIPAPPQWAQPFTSANLLPVLWTFTNSRISVRGMKFFVPAPNPAAPWPNRFAVPNLPAGALTTHLYAILLFAGITSSANIDQVDFQGSPNGTFFYSNNVHWAVAQFGGGFYSTFNIGSQTITRSRFRTMSGAQTAQIFADSTVRIGGSGAEGNLIEDVCFPIQIYVMSNMDVEISHNRFVSSARCAVYAINMTQGIGRNPALSRYQVRHNRFDWFVGVSANPNITTYVVQIADQHHNAGLTPRVEAVVANNVFSEGGRSAGGIYLFSLYKPLVSANHFSGVGRRAIAVGRWSSAPPPAIGSVNAVLQGNNISRYSSILADGAPLLIENSTNCFVVGSGDGVGKILMTGAGANTHTVTGLTPIGGSDLGENVSDLMDLKGHWQID